MMKIVPNIMMFKADSIVLSFLLNMFIATCTKYARKIIAGPYTKPFHPSATILKQTPAAIALAEAFLRCLNTSDKALMIPEGYAFVYRDKRSSPPAFTARR